MSVMLGTSDRCHLPPTSNSVCTVQATQYSRSENTTEAVRDSVAAVHERNSWSDLTGLVPGTDQEQCTCKEWRFCKSKEESDEDDAGEVVCRSSTERDAAPDEDCDGKIDRGPNTSEGDIARDLA